MGPKGAARCREPAGRFHGIRVSRPPNYTETGDAVAAPDPTGTGPPGPEGPGAVIAASAFALSASLAHSKPGRIADDAAFVLVNKGLMPTRLFFWLLTQGGWFGTVPLWCYLAVKHGKKRLAVNIAGSAALAWLSAQIFKRLLPLERPWERFQKLSRIGGFPRGNAFPSGHPAVAFAIARALAAEADLPPGLVTAARVGAVGVALSRVVVGAHYPLDVIGGAALGDLAGRAFVGASSFFTDSGNETSENSSLDFLMRAVDSPTEESPSPDDGAALEMR